jgi:hypothetical protein
MECNISQQGRSFEGKIFVLCHFEIVRVNLNLRYLLVTMMYLSHKNPEPRVDKIFLSTMKRPSEEFM